MDPNFVNSKLNSVKEISVQINDGIFVSRTIDTGLTLEKVREHLSNDEEIRIYDNMFFIGKKGKIKRSDEYKQLLSKNLHDGDILKITKEFLLDKKEAVDKYGLAYGFKMTSDGLKRAATSAFNINISDKGFRLDLEDTCEYTNIREYNNVIEDYYIKNLIANGKISIPLPKSLSVGFSISHERSNENTLHSELSSKYEIKIFQKAGIKIENSAIIPTDEFKEKVNNALKSKNPTNELRKICEEYGEYAAQKVKLGGKILTIKKGKSLKVLQRKKRMPSSSLKLGGNLAEVSCDYKNTKNKDISYSEVKTSIEIRDFGGDKSKFKSENIGPWQDSLNDDYKYWSIIEYDNIIPIFYILDDNLRQEVINITMGLRILHSGIEPIKATIIQPSRPFEHNLKHLPNLKGCQIFASIMGDKKKKRSIFYSCCLLVRFFSKYNPTSN
ncbi:hsp70 family protein [Gigaspora margarita]|uniref:Hsp70 family protein n=1 Tax=Gigaspora margarita TaxID=4874 RepID=A0A8H4ATV0_GIGMA|nr:hsp70 family protein [Gigaspora margarita]